MNINLSEKAKKNLKIAGIAVGVIGVGVVAYSMLKKKKPSTGAKQALSGVRKRKKSRSRKSLGSTKVLNLK